jgi:hypothetical protein
MPIKMSRLAFGGLVLAVGLGAGHAWAADAKKVADALVAAVTAEGKSQASYDDAATM